MLFQNTKQCCGKNSNDKAPVKVLFYELMKDYQNFDESKIIKEGLDDNKSVEIE